MSLRESSLPSLNPRFRAATDVSGATGPSPESPAGGVRATRSPEVQQVPKLPINHSTSFSHEGSGPRSTSHGSVRHLFDVAPAYQSFTSGGGGGRSTHPPAPVSGAGNANGSTGSGGGLRHPSRPLDPPSSSNGSSHHRSARGDSGNAASRTSLGQRPTTDSFVGNPAALATSQSLSNSRANSMTFGALAGALGNAFSFTSRSSAHTPMFLQDQHASVVGSFETTGSFFTDGHHPAGSRSGSAIHRASSRSSQSPMHAATASKGPSRHTKLPSVTSIIRSSIVAGNTSTATTGDPDEGNDPSDSSSNVNNNVGSLRRMLRKASSISFAQPSDGIRHATSVAFDRDDDTSGAANEPPQAFLNDSTAAGGVPSLGVVGHTSQAMRFVASASFERFRDLFDQAEGRPVAFTPAHRSRNPAGGGVKLNTFRSRSPGQAMSDEMRMQGTPNPQDGSLTPDAEAQPPTQSAAARGRHGGPRGGSTTEVVAMPSDMDDFGRGEEALRKYRDLVQLCRSAFPGAAAAKATAAGLALDGTKELDARLVTRATRWLELNQHDLLVGAMPNPLNGSWTSNQNLLSALSPTCAAAGGPSQPSLTPQPIMASTPEAFQLVPKDLHVLFSAWKHRKTGALFQRAFAAVSMALRTLMVPGALVTTPMNITYAVAGELVTATWLPPTTSTFPMKLVPKSLLSEISRLLSATLLGSFFATTSSSFGAFQEQDGVDHTGGVAEDHVPAVDFYACADGSYCAIPNANLIDALSMQRCETVLLNESTERMYFANSTASKRFTGSGVMGASPELANIDRAAHILARVAPMVFHEQRVEGSDKSLTTLIRDVLHANGVQIRELLNVREAVEKRSLSVSSGGATVHGRDQAAALQDLLQFMLNEAVARTLKAMILSRAAAAMHSVTTGGGPLCGSTGGERCTSPTRTRQSNASNKQQSSPKEQRQAPATSATTTIPNCPPHAAAILDAANLIFRKFLSSPKFLRESLVPALNKRFVTVSEYTIDPKMFLVRDISAFLQNRLGLCYNADDKSFSPFPLPSKIGKAHGKMHSPTLLRGPGVVPPRTAFGSPLLGPKPSPPVPGVMVSSAQPPQQSFILSLLHASFRSPVSPSGAVAQSLVTECTGTYLQQLSLACGEAEARVRAERRAHGVVSPPNGGGLPNALSGSDEANQVTSGELKSQDDDALGGTARPGTSSAAAIVRPTRPLAPADAACLLHLNQLLFATLLESNASPRATAPTGTTTDGLVKSSTFEHHQANSGIGPSIARLARRIARLYVVPPTVLATLHHCSQDSAVGTANDPLKTSAPSTRPTSPGSSHSKNAVMPSHDPTPQAENLQHRTVAIPHPPAAQPVPSGGLQGSGARRASRSSRGQEERPSIASFTVYEMETILQLMCLEKQHSAATMDPSDEEDLAASLRCGGRGGIVRSVPACDSLLISTMVELSMLNQRAPVEALGSTDERLLHGAGAGSGFGWRAIGASISSSFGFAGGDTSRSTVQVDPLMLWAMAVSNMGAHVFDPFLLHHATRALLLAKLLKKEAAAQWGAVLADCHQRMHSTMDDERTPTPQGRSSVPAASPPLRGVPPLSHEILRAVCNAICICSTASPTAMLTSDAALLLSTGLAFFATPSSADERQVGATLTGPERCLAPFALRCAAFLTRRTVLQHKTESQAQQRTWSQHHAASVAAHGGGSGVAASSSGGGAEFTGGIATSQSYSTDELVASQIRVMPAASLLFVALMAPYLLSVTPGHDPLVSSVGSSSAMANERRSSTSTVSSSESMRHLRARWSGFVDALQGQFAHRVQHMAVSEESQGVRAGAAMLSDAVSETGSHCSTPAVVNTPQAFSFGSPLAEHFAFQCCLDDEACWGLIQQSPAVQEYLSTVRYVLFEDGYTRHRSPGSKQNLAAVMEFAGVGSSLSTDASTPGAAAGNVPQVFLEDASMQGAEFLWSTPEVLKYFTMQLDLMLPQLSAAFEHSSRLSAEGTEDPFSYPVSFEVGEGVGVGSVNDSEPHQISSSSAHSIGGMIGTQRAAVQAAGQPEVQGGKPVAEATQQQQTPACPLVDAPILSTSTVTYDGLPPPYLQGETTNEYRSFGIDSSHASMLLEAIRTSSPAPNHTTSSTTLTPTAAAVQTTEDGLLSPRAASHRGCQHNEATTPRGSAHTTPRTEGLYGALHIEEARGGHLGDGVVMEVPELLASSPDAPHLKGHDEASEVVVVREVTEQTESVPAAPAPALAPQVEAAPPGQQEGPTDGSETKRSSDNCIGVEGGRTGDAMILATAPTTPGVEGTIVPANDACDQPPRETSAPSPQHSCRHSSPVSPDEAHLFLDVPPFLSGAQGRAAQQFLSTSTATSEGLAPPSLQGTNEYRSSFGIESSRGSIVLLEETRRLSHVTTSGCTTITTTTTSTNNTSVTTAAPSTEEGGGGGSSRGTTQRPHSTQEELTSAPGDASTIDLQDAVHQADFVAYRTPKPPLDDRHLLLHDEASHAAHDVAEGRSTMREDRVEKRHSTPHGALGTQPSALLKQVPSADLAPSSHDELVSGSALPAPSPSRVRRSGSETNDTALLSRNSSSSTIHPHQPSPQHFRRGSHVRAMLEHVELASSTREGSVKDTPDAAGELPAIGVDLRRTQSDSIRSTSSEFNSPRHCIAHLVMILRAEEEIRRDILSDEEIDAMLRIRECSEFSYSEASRCASSPDIKRRPFRADGERGTAAVPSPNSSGSFSLASKRKESRSTSPPSDAVPNTAGVAPDATPLPTFAVPHPPTAAMRSPDVPRASSLLHVSSRPSSMRSPDILDHTAAYATAVPTPLSSPPPPPPLEDQGEDVRMVANLFNQAFASREMLMRGSIVREESVFRSQLTKRMLPLS